MPFVLSSQCSNFCVTADCGCVFSPYFKTSGNSIFDIRFGDTLFLKNTELVNDADYDETSLGAGNGTAGTVRLVAKRIEYHLTKPSAGAGGITRSIKGIKRFTA